jgi:hypothetical protein
MKKTICVGLLLCLLSMFCVGGAVSAAALTGDGSFEEETVGTISNNTEIFSKDWVEKNGQGEAASVIAEEEGNRYLNASGLLELQSAKTVDAPYTFSVDLRTETPKADWLGVFIRTGDVFNLYEWDFYAEKGGTEGSSSIGAVGIVIYPVIDGIRLAVKTRAEGPWGTSCAYADIVVEGNPDWKEFTTLKVEDDGSVVKIYVEDALAATVELSNEGTYPEDAATEIPEYLEGVYYKTAVVKDASGTELFRTDSARVAAEDCYLGFGVRENAIDIDNISISGEEEEPTDPEPVDPEPTDPEPTDPEPADPNPGTGDLSISILCLAALLSAVSAKALRRKARL